MSRPSILTAAGCETPRGAAHAFMVPPTTGACVPSTPPRIRTGRRPRRRRCGARLARARGGKPPRRGCALQQRTSRRAPKVARHATGSNSPANWPSGRAGEVNSQRADRAHGEAGSSASHAPAAQELQQARMRPRPALFFQSRASVGASPRSPGRLRELWQALGGAAPCAQQRKSPHSCNSARPPRLAGWRAPDVTYVSPRPTQTGMHLLCRRACLVSLTGLPRACLAPSPPPHTPWRPRRSPSGCLRSVITAAHFVYKASSRRKLQAAAPLRGAPPARGLGSQRSRARRVKQSPAARAAAAQGSLTGCGLRRRAAAGLGQGVQRGGDGRADAHASAGPPRPAWLQCIPWYTAFLWRGAPA